MLEGAQTLTEAFPTLSASIKSRIHVASPASNKARQHMLGFLTAAALAGSFLTQPFVNAGTELYTSASLG